MQFSILTGILVTTAIALTLALATAGEFSYFVFYGVIQLVIAGSIAIPFVCKKTSLPFWAAYAVTTGFVLIKQGQGTEPFQLFLAYLIYFMLGDVSELPTDSALGILGVSLRIWSPVWLGAIVGGCFALINRLVTHADPKE